MFPIVKYADVGVCKVENLVDLSNIFQYTSGALGVSHLSHDATWYPAYQTKRPTTSCHLDQ